MTFSFYNLVFVFKYSGYNYFASLLKVKNCSCNILTSLGKCMIIL